MTLLVGEGVEQIVTIDDIRCLWGRGWSRLLPLMTLLVGEGVEQIVTIDDIACGGGGGADCYH